MSQTPEDSSIPSGNATEGAEALDRTTSQNSQILVEVDSLNTAQVSFPQTDESPSSVHSDSKENWANVLEDPAMGTENDTTGQKPTRKKRKSPIEEKNGSSILCEDSNIAADLSTSDESFSNSIVTEKDTIDQVPTSKNPIPSIVIEYHDESTISEDAKLAYIVADLSTSDESFSNSKLEVSSTEDSRLGDSSKLESNKKDVKSEDSSKSEDSKSEDPSTSGDSSREDSESKDSSKSEDSKSEDSSKSDDSNTEDSKSESNCSTNTAKEHSSDETEIDESQIEYSNQSRHFRKKKPSICEEKESSDSDKESPSIPSTHKEPVDPKIHPKAISSNVEFFPHISDDSSKSKASSVNSREGSVEDTESCVSGEENVKQELSSRKRKLSITVGGATEDADSEEETSSNDDSHKSIKRRKKLTKTHK